MPWRRADLFYTSEKRSNKTPYGSVQPDGEFGVYQTGEKYGRLLLHMLHIGQIIVRHAQMNSTQLKGFGKSQNVGIGAHIFFHGIR